MRKRLSKGKLIVPSEGFAMGSHQKLPFKVGQLAESKSFQTGYRGAWFRCKINDIRKKKGELNHSLEYFDFPDEKVRWTKLYQIPSRVSPDERKLHLMVRPSFPKIYTEAQMPETVSEVIAITDNVWKVGDLVDWFTDGCYWSARITHELGEEKVKIELPDPPAGEGDCYEVPCKELRPSLDWSPECGWTLPISLDSNARPCCVRLVSPKEEETQTTTDVPTIEEASLELSTASLSSHTSLPSLSSKGTPEKERLSNCSLNEQSQLPCETKNADLDEVDMLKPSSSDNISTTHVSEEEKEAIDSRSPPKKKLRVCEEEIISSDGIESSILELEELVNKIKWIKRVHEFGFRIANAMTPSWKFLEDRAGVTRI